MIDYDKAGINPVLSWENERRTDPGFSNTVPLEKVFSLIKIGIHCQRMGGFFLL
jgi:hypothetical protein